MKWPGRRSRSWSGTCAGCRAIGSRATTCLDMAAALQAAFAAPTELMAGAESVGDPIALLPVLFHLLWCHRFRADLSVPLSPDTQVAAVGARQRWGCADGAGASGAARGRSRHL